MGVQQYRRPRAPSVSVCLLALALCAPASAQDRPPDSGVLRVLTYNVAGLPEGISRSRPTVNIPRIGPRFDAYDIVLVQEDFAFQDELRAGVGLPHCSTDAVSSERDRPADGLNRFSRVPFAEHERRAWTSCNGLLSEGCDCLAPKGFSVATHEIAPGRYLDVYNLHMDAGGTARDRAARDDQVEQLLAALRERSAGRAVIVAGDTNFRRGDERLARRLLREGGLVDACQALGCGADRVDRVLVRSSPTIVLEPRRYRMAHEFVDDAGRPLSDHLAVDVEIAWRVLAPPAPRLRASPVAARHRPPAARQSP
jgi:endonuclease/exonuclease/phosphatase family metal-dependent hydrolase